jgi:hypothetical protein
VSIFEHDYGYGLCGPGTERGAGEYGAVTGWLLGTQALTSLDKCAETDEHDLRVRRDVVGLPLCQRAAVVVLPAGLVEHAGDVLERVVSGSRADGGRGEQQQTSMSHVTGDLRWRQLFGLGVTRGRGGRRGACDRGEWPAACRGTYAAGQVHRRLAQLEHGQGLYLTVVLADPFPGQAQLGGRRFHVGRRQVAGAGELGAFGTNAVQEPPIGADHAVGGLGVHEDGFKDVGVGEQVQELDLRDRVLNASTSSTTCAGSSARMLRYSLLTGATLACGRGGPEVRPRAGKNLADSAPPTPRQLA